MYFILLQPQVRQGSRHGEQRVRMILNYKSVLFTETFLTV